MNNRIATILSPTDLGAAGTKVIDINLVEAISRITMVWKCTNVTVSAMTDTVLSCISKIELVDGSDILFSCSGSEAQALNFFDRKVMPHNAISLTVGGMFEAEISIDFGRFLWDTELAFLPSKFKNPQLKITWDEDSCNASVVVNSFQVYAYVLGGAIASPIGFIQSREFNQYAMAASSHKYIDLPIDYPLKRIMIRGYSTDHDPITLFDTLKLTVDNDKHIPINMKADDFYRSIKALYPRIAEKVTLDAVVTAKDIYANVSKDIDIHIEYDGTAFVTAQSLFAVPTYTGAKIALAASVDIQADLATILGECPHNCFPIDFGLHNDKDTWLDLSGSQSFKADLLSSSDADSGDTSYIVTQQLRRY